MTSIVVPAKAETTWGFVYSPHFRASVASSQPSQ